LDTTFFILSKVLGVALKIETWLFALAFVAFWANVRRYNKLALYSSAALAFMILSLCVLPVGDVLLRPLETTLPISTTFGEVDGIILLGGGEDVHASLASGQPQVGEGGDRYLAALALAHKYPEARLLFTGGNARLWDVNENEISESVIAERILMPQGIDSDRLLFESKARNTAENAKLSFALVEPQQDDNWILITSAFHMPRAVRSFKAAGWSGIIPYPVDFQTRHWSSGFGWNLHRNLRLTNIAIREWVGRIVYTVTAR
jgi:uncharacterized SAM-binding protein YcdF (DUF218 family)